MPIIWTARAGTVVLATSDMKRKVVTEGKLSGLAFTLERDGVAVASCSGCTGAADRRAAAPAPRPPCACPAWALARNDHAPPCPRAQPVR